MAPLFAWALTEEGYHLKHMDPTYINASTHASRAHVKASNSTWTLNFINKKETLNQAHPTLLMEYPSTPHHNPRTVPPTNLTRANLKKKKTIIIEIKVTNFSLNFSLFSKNFFCPQTEGKMWDEEN